MDLVEMQVRLPKTLCAKIDRLAALGGLTGDQMAQAILVLQFHSQGWLKDETTETIIAAAE